MQDLAQFIANHLALTYTLATTLVLLMFIEFLRAKRNYCSVDTARAVQLINRENGVVIDIRSKEQYKDGHIVDAYSFAAANLIANTKPIEKFKKRPIIIVCGSGVEAQKFATFLVSKGFFAHALAGGVRAWSEAELPLVKA